MMAVRLNMPPKRLPDAKLLQHGDLQMLRIDKGLYVFERPALQPGIVEALLLRKLHEDGEHVLIVYTDARHHCSCEDFEHASGRAGRPCKHLAAAYLAGLLTRHCPPGIRQPPAAVDANAVSQFDIIAELEASRQAWADALDTLAGDKLLYALKYAEAAEAMRRQMPHDVAKVLAGLAGQPHGFSVDRNDYPLEILRECMVDGLLQGVSLAGNEMAVIDGHMMIVKLGWQRKLGRLEGIESIEEVELLSRPEKVPDLGLRVQCKLSYRLDGRDHDFIRGCHVDDEGGEIGIDAFTGKCQRKMMKALYEKLVAAGVRPRRKL